MREHKQRGIVLINEDGERKDFQSINAAACFLGTNFSNVQKAAIYNGTLRGWRVFETPDAIRLHIKELQAQLQVLEG